MMKVLINTYFANFVLFSQKFAYTYRLYTISSTNQSNEIMYTLVVKVLQGFSRILCIPKVRNV